MWLASNCSKRHPRPLPRHHHIDDLVVLVVVLPYSYVFFRSYIAMLLAMWGPDSRSCTFAGNPVEVGSLVRVHDKRRGTVTRIDRANDKCPGEVLFRVGAEKRAR